MLYTSMGNNDEINFKGNLRRSEIFVKIVRICQDLVKVIE